MVQLWESSGRFEVGLGENGMGVGSVELSLLDESVEVVSDVIILSGSSMEREAMVMQELCTCLYIYL